MKGGNEYENVSPTEKLIGMRIGIERTKKGETQESLAEAIGVSKQIIQHWESGTRHIKADNLKDLATHFDCTADYLIGIDLDPTKNGDVAKVCSETGLKSETVDWLKLEKQLFDKDGENAARGTAKNLPSPTIALFLNYLVQHAPQKFSAIQTSTYNAIAYKLLENDPDAEMRLQSFLEEHKDSDLLKELQEKGGIVVTNATRSKDALNAATKQIDDLLSSFIDWVSVMYMDFFLVGLARQHGASNADLLKIAEFIRRKAMEGSDNG